MEEGSAHSGKGGVTCSSMVKFEYPVTSVLAGKMLEDQHQSYLIESGLADFAKKVMWSSNEVPEEDLVEFVSNFSDKELATYVRGHTLDLSLASIRTIFHLPAGEGEVTLAKVERSLPKDYKFKHPLPEEAQGKGGGKRKFQLQDFEASSLLHERLAFQQVALHVKSKSRRQEVAASFVKQVLDEPTLQRDWGAYLHKRLVKVLLEWQKPSKLEDDKKPIFPYGSHVKVVCGHFFSSEYSTMPCVGGNRGFFRPNHPGDDSKESLVDGAEEQSYSTLEVEELDEARRPEDVEEQGDDPSQRMDLATLPSQIDGCFPAAQARIVDATSDEPKLTMGVSNGGLSDEPAKQLGRMSEDSVDSAGARVGEGCEELTRKVAGQLCRIVELEDNYVCSATKFTEFHEKMVSLGTTIAGLRSEVDALVNKVVQQPSNQPPQVLFTDAGPLLTKTKPANADTDREDNWESSKVRNLSRKRACGWQELPVKRARRKTVRFSPEESSAIQAGVQKHGLGKWSSIRHENWELFSRTKRTDVDLKDRWRNMSKGKVKAPLDIETHGLYSA